MLRRALGLTTSVLLGLTPAAGAATLTTGPDGTIAFVAAPGEQNVVTVQSDGLYRVQDTGGAPLTVAHPDCTTVDATTATCAPRGVTVVLGDGDDVLSAGVRFFTSADGGPGNDQITVAHGTARGGAGDDVLQGASALDGGPGADRLTGGPEGQELRGGAGADVLDGGGGRDVTSYADARAGVQVDLARDRASDGDVLGSIESVDGSPFADVLRGDEQANRLNGAGGDDVVTAGGGADEVTAAQGDSVEAGAGADAISVRSPDVRRLECGAGQDVARASVRGADAADCERIDLGDAAVEVAGVRPGSVLLACFDPGEGCQGRLTIRSRAGAVLATCRFDLEGDEKDRSVRLKLTAAGRRVLRRGARPPIVLTSGDRRVLARLRVRGAP